MHFLRTPVLCAVLFTLLNGSLPAQKKKKPGDDEGYVPVIVPEGKKKKKDHDVTQPLPPPKELPSAIAADTDRPTFEVSPLQGKGLLSAQTREALRSLLRTNRGTIVKLRAFVAGSGDLRRIGELVGETFTERRQPLPSLSVAQVGALPLVGAPVVIAPTELANSVVNPTAVPSLSVQSAATDSQSIT